MLDKSFLFGFTFLTKDYTLGFSLTCHLFPLHH